MNRPVVIDALGLGVRVGRSDLLRGVNVQVRAGERVALVGANGAGKSTLLRAMSGFVPVAQGQLMVMGTALHPRPRRAALRQLRQHVAQVHQGLHLVDRLSVLDNVLIGAAAQIASPLTWLRRWPQVQMQAAAVALDRVGMGWAAHRRTDSLSGGERQKVAIARALLQIGVEPVDGNQAPDRHSLLLADEPTASLDADAAREVLDLLGAVVAQRRCTLVCVLHDLAAVPRIAQRALVLRQGQLVADQVVSPEAMVAGGVSPLKEWFK